MGFELQVATGRSIAIKPAKSTVRQRPSISESCSQHRADKRLKWFTDDNGSEAHR